MTEYIIPTSGNRLWPDIVGGNVNGETEGNPPLPGTQFSGPVLAGNNKESDGTGYLANAGESGGTANSGYSTTAQSCAVTQATNTGTAGQFACPIVVPAYSQILRITLMVTTAWSTTATLGIGSGASATAFTTAGAITASALGPESATPGANATQIANWINVGSQDVQIVLQSTNTGSGVGVLTVEYLQSNNAGVTP